jgi:hypothetical protein
MQRFPNAYLSHSPSPDLTPEEVVKIQLDALQNNDLMGDNAGIRAAWNFASPSNRIMIGTIEQFIGLVKNPLYSPMIGFERAEVGRAIIHEREAQVAARLYRGKRGLAAYVFVLSRQQDVPYRNCWMTDSAFRLD